MILHHDLPYERFYEPAHMIEVLDDMRRNFGRYFQTFAPSPPELASRLNEHVASFLDEQLKYQPVLDLDFLYDCDVDPGTFKNIFKSKYPIIRRCLNSRSKLMDGYRRDFNRTNSEDLLAIVTNIVEFAQEYKGKMDASRQAVTETPSALGVSLLDGDGYSTSGVIGGGIRSHFLYHIAPHIFPNRSQSAIWALYFLTDRKDYGFEDYSEFLMVDSGGGKGTQQNYFYPYDLFTWYGLQIFLLLRKACQPLDYQLTDYYRFVYLDAFLGHIAQVHQDDINVLRPQFDEEFYY